MISVIIPVYRVEKYLSGCIESLLAQENVSLEMILVDDGSPDKCGEIIDEYARKHDNIKAVHKENGGLSSARNTGLRIAEGGYIAFVDGDDRVHPQYLATLLAAMRRTGADICECAFLKVAETEADGIRHAAVPPAEDISIQSFDCEEALRLLIEDRELHQVVWNKLYRREAIEGLFFPEGRLHEDEFWTYRAFAGAERIAKITVSLYYYIQRKGSITSDTYSLKRLDGLDAKVERQRFIEERFPALAEEAGKNLFHTCMYAGQMSLKYLKGRDRTEARKRIDEVRKQCGELHWSVRETWRWLSWRNFWGTAWLRVILNRGF